MLCTTFAPAPPSTLTSPSLAVTCIERGPERRIPSYIAVKSRVATRGLVALLSGVQEAEHDQGGRLASAKLAGLIRTYRASLGMLPKHVKTSTRAGLY